MAITSKRLRDFATPLKPKCLDGSCYPDLSDHAVTLNTSNLTSWERLWPLAVLGKSLSASVLQVWFPAYWAVRVETRLCSLGETTLNNVRCNIKLPGQSMDVEHLLQRFPTVLRGISPTSWWCLVPLQRPQAVHHSSHQSGEQTRMFPNPAMLLRLLRWWTLSLMRMSLMQRARRT